jgi:hypothetical protein
MTRRISTTSPDDLYGLVISFSDRLPADQA